MKIKKFSIVAILGLALLLLVVAITPAAAVTNGELDGEAHPHVVLLLMEIDGAPAFRCSGTLIAPTILLTAGHCAGATGEFSGMRVFTDSDVDDGNGTTNNYPFGGGNSVEATHWAAHPGYDAGPWFVYDVGVVKLADPIALGAYGSLPPVDSLDVLGNRRGHQDMTFEAVGYGGQASSPVPSHNQFDRVRMRAYPKLNQINAKGMTGDFSLLLSNNHKTGGTCFGDSGGPNFYPSNSNTVAGITSYGLNGNCAGTGGVFRTDREGVQDFINDFIANPYTP